MFLDGNILSLEQIRNLFPNMYKNISNASSDYFINRSFTIYPTPKYLFQSRKLLLWKNEEKFLVFCGRRIIMYEPKRTKNNKPINSLNTIEPQSRSDWNGKKRRADCNYRIGI